MPVSKKEVIDWLIFMSSAGRRAPWTQEPARPFTVDLPVPAPSAQFLALSGCSVDGGWLDEWQGTLSAELTFHFLNKGLTSCTLPSLSPWLSAPTCHRISACTSSASYLSSLTVCSLRSWWILLRPSKWAAFEPLSDFSSALTPLLTSGARLAGLRGAVLSLGHKILSLDVAEWFSEAANL